MNSSSDLESDGPIRFVSTNRLSLVIYEQLNKLNVKLNDSDEMI